MGIKLFSSSSNDCNCRTRTVVEQVPVFRPSPEPDNYEIVKHEHIRGHLVVMVHYKDVTNYEGNKVMVYRNCTIDKLKAQGRIDPHFSSNKKMYSPIARFEPTDEGWFLACFIARSI